MRRFDTLFARLFLVFLATIVLAHLLALAWFVHYGPPPPPPAPAGETAAPRPLIDLGGLPPTPGSTRQQTPDRPAGLPPFFSPPFIAQVFALVLAAWISARLLARPIARLGEAAIRLSDDLDSPALPEHGPREARQAAAAFNRMRTSVRQQIQQRNRMLVAVSHDLRTPLARLKLRLEDIPDAALRERCTRDVGEMGQLIEATLRYLRQQGTEEPLQCLDVQALIEALAEDARDEGAEVMLAGQAAPLSTRPAALRSCLGNLLENALRYAGSACFELHDGPAALEIRIVDHGPGIPAAERERVFDPFYRLESSRNRHLGGVGLGLAIARDAAGGLGGALHLEDTPGGGLTAVVRLPRREP